MKKYTTPEIEVIKFQIVETIANNTVTPTVSGGVTTLPDGAPNV